MTVYSWNISACWAFKSPLPTLSPCSTRLLHRRCLQLPCSVTSMVYILLIWVLYGLQALFRGSWCRWAGTLCKFFRSCSVSLFLSHFPLMLFFFLVSIFPHTLKSALTHARRFNPLGSIVCCPLDCFYGYSVCGVLRWIQTTDVAFLRRSTAARDWGYLWPSRGAGAAELLLRGRHGDHGGLPRDIAGCRSVRLRHCVLPTNCLPVVLRSCLNFFPRVIRFLVRFPPLYFFLTCFVRVVFF